MDSLGLKNRLRLILPNERGSFRERNRMKRDLPRDEPRGSDTRGQGSDTRGQGSESKTGPISVTLGFSNDYYVSTFVPQESDDNSSVGQTTEQVSSESINVPGADVEIRQTKQGIVIFSEHLDAADAVESKILDMIEVDSSAELPQVYSIKYRKVNEVKGVLEHIFGIQSSGGGGCGGGIGGLIGGAVQNTVGGSAGDVLGGLLGGGDGGFGSDSAGAFELEGEDVRMVTDTRLNYLFITGATTNDLEFIEEIIVLIDVDSPAEPPSDIGKTYIIQINYRDPMDIKEIVEEMLADRIKNVAGNANAGGRQQDAQAQVQQALIRQLSGGNGRNRRGGGAAAAGNNNAEQPKATLGVDEELGALLVTGPEFIYLEVKNFVAQLDIRQDVVVAVEETKMNAMAIATYLRDMFPDQIEIVMNDGEDDAGGGATIGGANSSRRTTGSARGGGSNRAGSRNTPDERALENVIRQRISNGGRNVRAPGR